MSWYAPYTDSDAVDSGNGYAEDMWFPHERRPRVTREPSRNPEIMNIIDSAVARNKAKSDFETARAKWFALMEASSPLHRTQEQKDEIERAREVSGTLWLKWKMTENGL
jgi:hypothetical protein